MFIADYYTLSFVHVTYLGVVTSQLQERLESKLFFGTKQKVDVTVKLHLIMPNAEKKSPVSREVTTANYRECFSLVRESALFQFAAFSIAHDIIIEEPIEQMLGKNYKLYLSKAYKCISFYTYDTMHISI